MEGPFRIVACPLCCKLWLQLRTISVKKTEEKYKPIFVGNVPIWHEECSECSNMLKEKFESEKVETED